MKSKEIVYDSERDVIAAIDSLISVADRSPESRKFFSKSVRDLESLKARIGNHDTRIAIVGITSSGKSTLMNAVLGADLLPARVGPSSSRQVLCGWGTEQMAEIRFDPETRKPPRVLKGRAEKIRSEIEKYGDERYNPGNRENVDEIRVHASKFKFNRDLVIIDTPGLDAYGLDQHKEVTMKLVLPTVDMVLFLTNVKCDSDAANLSFLDAATTDDKPLVVVQNKIDSIEAKVAREGVVKTVEEIKLEHRHRLERLLASAKKSSVRTAPIVQVSAKTHANLGELKRVLDEQIRMNARFRLGRRVSQFSAIVREMLDVLRPKLAESKQTEAASQLARQSLQAKKEALDSLKAFCDSVATGIRVRRTAVRKCATELLESIDRQYAERGLLGNFFCHLTNDDRLNMSDAGKRKYRKVERLSDGINQQKIAFEGAMKDLNAFFSRSITETQEKTRECCRALNLDESQIVRSEPFHSTYVSIQEKRKGTRRKVSEEVPEEGFWGGFKRFFTFGLCGYRTETHWETEYSVNIADYVKQIVAAYNSFISAVSSQFQIYRRNGDFAIEKFEEELRSRSEMLETQEHSSLSLQDGKAIEEALLRHATASLSADDGHIQNAKSAQRNVTPPSRRFQSCELSPEVFYAAKFAHESSFLCSYALVDEMVRRSGCGQVAVCGWDRERLQSFKDYFVRDAKMFSFVDFSAPEVRMPSPDALTFLLVNAEQAGSFRGKLLGGGAASEFVSKTVRSGKVVWVMDSVREHVSARAAGDAFADAFYEMMRLVREALRGAPLFDVMVCDRELYWSVLLHELVFNSRLSASEHARQEFVNAISNLFRLSPERRDATGSYVVACTRCNSKPV